MQLTVGRQQSRHIRATRAKIRSKGMGITQVLKPGNGLLFQVVFLDGLSHRLSSATGQIMLLQV